MTRKYLPILIVVLALASLAAWIARHTYWAPISVPQAPTGEALTNPRYAAQRLVALLGGHARRLHLAADLPRPAGVLVLANFKWSLIDQRQQQLEQWVEQGGQLLVDESTANDVKFEKWSRIVSNVPKPTESEASASVVHAMAVGTEPCSDFQVSPQVRFLRNLRLCGVKRWGWLSTSREPLWSVNNEDGYQALRVSVGRGSVTRIHGEIDGNSMLLRADNGLLFAYAAQLGRGQDVSFLTETQAMPLIALIWHYGAPVVMLALLALVLGLWRGGVRFGPLSQATDPARRSLGEQIRGTAHFALRFGAGGALRGAAARALAESARSHLVGYGHMSRLEQTAALAAASGLPAAQLAWSLADRPRTRHELTNDVASLVLARRLLTERARGRRVHAE